MDLINKMNDYKVTQLPDTAYYIPDFVQSEEEEMNLLKKVYASPKPKWKTLSNRRLQNWGGLPHPKGMIQEGLPQWLSECVQKVAELQIFGDKIPNHVLVNEYLPGQGIMPHEDGPLFYPTIATISLGSPTVLNYYKKTDNSDDQNMDNHNGNDRYVGSLLLERRSLLVVQEELYHKYLHGIKENKFDVLNDDIKNIQLCQRNIGTSIMRETRISLTIRHVPNTVKAPLLFKIK